MKFGRPKAEAPEINLIPFIDILLVVLIFLMLTTTYARVSKMRIELPAVHAAPSAASPPSIDLAISRDGRYMVGSVPVADAQGLPAALREAAKGLSEPTVTLVADAAATHQSVMDAMRATSDAGLPRVAFATKSSAPPVPRPR